MIYIGGYYSEHNCGIYELNDDLSLNKHICEDEGSSYFDVCDENIYTISKKEDKGGVALYDLKGNLKASVYFDLRPGCFIEKHEDKVYVSYYHDALLQIFDLKLNLIQEIKYPKGSKCHQVFFMKDKIGVVLLGLDKILFYDKNMNFINEIQFPINSGPRHAIASKDEKELYVISELSNELFIIDLDTHNFKQTFSIKESDVPTTGAAIRMSKDGKHLYASTRGQNLLKHFACLEKWEEVQCIQLKGDLPRDFNLFDRFMVVGYQNSNLVEKYELNENEIGKCISSVEYEKIVCVK